MRKTSAPWPQSLSRERKNSANIVSCSLANQQSPGHSLAGSCYLKNGNDGRSLREAPRPGENKVSHNNCSLASSCAKRRGLRLCRALCRRTGRADSGNRPLNNQSPVYLAVSFQNAGPWFWACVGPCACKFLFQVQRTQTASVGGCFPLGCCRQQPRVRNQLTPAALAVLCQ